MGRQGSGLARVRAPRTADVPQYPVPMRRLGFYLILTADGMYADPDGGLAHYDPAEDEHQFANDLTRDADAEIGDDLRDLCIAFFADIDEAIERAYQPHAHRIGSRCAE